MMKITILFLLTFFGLNSNILAYPISPVPLRQLVIESEYIIVGYVVKTFDKKKGKNERGGKIAKIAVLQNLQGQIRKDTIEIEFNPNMICPAPARYFDSTYVISFVNRNEESNNFYTHALSYGAKTLEQEEIEIYKQRISEIQQILKISDSEKQRTETVEWLVKCAENETTQWEGTFELSPESDFMSYYSRDEKQNFKDLLSINQKDRLKKALFNTNGMVDFGLVDLTYQGNETQIDNFLLHKLENLKEDEYWLAGSFMNKLKHKNNSTEMTAVLEEYDKMQFEDDKKDELKKTIKSFIKLIKK